MTRNGDDVGSIEVSGSSRYWSVGPHRSKFVDLAEVLRRCGLVDDPEGPLPIENQIANLRRHLDVIESKIDDAELRLWELAEVGEE